MIMKIISSMLKILALFYNNYIGGNQCLSLHKSMWGAVAQWLESKTGDREVLGSNPLAQLRNFGNSVYAAFPVYIGRDTKTKRHQLVPSKFYQVAMPEEAKHPTQGVDV